MNLIDKIKHLFNKPTEVNIIGNDTFILKVVEHIPIMYDGVVGGIAKIQNTKTNKEIWRIRWVVGDNPLKEINYPIHVFSNIKEVEKHFKRSLLK